MMTVRKENENSYRNILKGTSMLGGVQMLQILVSLIRGKFVALFLGPDGMGVSSLFTSSSNTIGQISNLGLNLAIVKETAGARDNPGALAHVARVAMSLINVAAVLGCLFCVLFAPWLSLITFGNDDFAWQFMLLGVVIYLMVLGGGKSAMLQGLHQVKLISRATVIGSTAGLIGGVPLYWLFGVRGIVPAMVIMFSATALYFSLALRKVLPGNRVPFSWQSHKPLVKRMILLGLLLMSSTLIATLCSYLLNIFIRTFGALDDVGLFNAANSITNQYSNLVFTAMSIDYFPRLTSAAKDTKLMNLLVNRQTEIVAYIIAPVAILVILTSPFIIRILLTYSFIEITPLVRWMAFGILFKALSFPMGYIAFAKDNRRLFFWLEGVMGNLIYIGLSLLFYYRFGLMGLGYSMVLENLIVLSVYFIVNAVTYGYRFDRNSFTALLSAILLGSAAFLSSFMPDRRLAYIFMALCAMTSALFSIIRLKKLLRSDPSDISGNADDDIITPPEA